MSKVISNFLASYEPKPSDPLEFLNEIHPTFVLRGSSIALVGLAIEISFYRLRVAEMKRSFDHTQ